MACFSFNVCLHLCSIVVLIFAEIKETITIKKKKMTTLENLASGYKTCAVTNPLPPEVLAALAASVTTQQQVTRTGTPVDARTVDFDSLHGGEENVTELTWTNNTAVPVIYTIGGLITEPGDAIDFGLAGNFSYDFPAAQGSGAEPAAAGSDNRVLNKKLQLVPAIIGRLSIRVSSVGAQKNERLIIYSNNFANDSCLRRVLPPECLACPGENGESDTRLVSFACPRGVGEFNTIGYTLLPGQSATVQIHWIARAVHQFKSLTNGDCAC